ncbi:MAG TPA: response regulator [Desulfobacteraceae bacterium]|nr:response regulator [Desulfobacteraceae bacterium]
MKHIDVLIIDDEEKFAAMLSKRIMLRGFSSDICHDGGQALEWVADPDNRATLILLDLQLPDMYGTNVLTEIKKIDPAVPVIILTGHGTEKDREECSRLGAYRFVHKPIQIDDIVAVLGEIGEAKSQ